MNEYPLQSLKQKKADADKRLMIQRDIIAKILNDPRYEFEQAVALGDVKGSRDAKMEKTLRNEHLNHPDKHILVITGMGHMYGNTDGKSMYSRITDLETRRIFLPAMERIESE